MIKKLMMVLLVSSGFLLSGGLRADAAGTRVAFINVQQLMVQSPQAMKARETLKQDFGSREQALAHEGQSIRAAEKKMQNQKAFMSSAQQKKAEAKLQQRVADFNKKMDQFRHDFAKKRQELLQNLEKHLYQVIIKVAQEKKYDMVVSTGVVYADKSVNITPAVLAELKK